MAAQYEGYAQHVRHSNHVVGGEHRESLLPKVGRSPSFTRPPQVADETRRVGSTLFALEIASARRRPIPVFRRGKGGDSFTMDGLRPVTFRFDAHTEMRYLAQAPDVGDLVGHGHELWIVVHVSIDAVGVIVVCRRPRGSDGHLRLVA